MLAGATVTASLVAEGCLSLDTPVHSHLPGLDHRITVRHLLHHSSGLPAWRPLYELAPRPWGTDATRSTMLDAVRSTPLESTPGLQHRYSDLGFLVLLELVERVTQTPFQHLFAERVLGPTKIEDMRWGWPSAAATEDCPIRGRVMEGTVHDLNCDAMGGVSTHAGLFGTARSVADLGDRLLRATLGDPSCKELPGKTLHQFWNEKGPGSHRLGWDGVSTGYTSTGKHFPPDTVGHLGYTGCGLWIAPRRRTVVALLTNRVHPIDTKDAIRRARPAIHDAVASALGWDTGQR